MNSTFIQYLTEEAETEDQTSEKFATLKQAAKAAGVKPETIYDFQKWRDEVEGELKTTTSARAKMEMRKWLKNHNKKFESVITKARLNALK